MFILLNPAALLALLGLLVPVAIHLWNRRPGREVAVGSLRWLAAGANRRLRNLRLEQLGLLLLRAALLAVLALAVAGPAWRQALPSGRGQVLLSAELVGAPALAALRPAIDSLRRAGYGLRWLAPGFPKLSAAAWRADSAGLRDSAQLLAGTAGTAAGFYWAQVRQASGSFAGQPLYVVTPAALRGFQGTHLPLAPTVTWQALPLAAASTWLQGAAGQGDSLRLLLGQGTERQTTFRRVAVARPQPGAVLQVAGLPALRLVAGATGPQLQPLASASAAPEPSGPAVPVRTGPLRVVIYASPAYAADARFLQAGLRAAAAGLPVSLVLTTVGASSAPPRPAARPDWLFWLTDAPLPPAWREAVRRGAHVWQEAAAPGRADPAQLVAATADEAPVMVFRRGTAAGPAERTASQTLWADGLGRPVLSRRLLGRGAFYQLHTRLDAAWSELADSPALPARLLALLQPAPADDAAPTTSDQALTSFHDQRALDPAQLMLSAPRAAGQRPVASASAGPADFRLTDLRPWAVLAAALLFALERLLAFRRERPTLPSAPVS